jgi:hypothetical protein
MNRRLPPVSVARRQESTCRVGHDLHHPQSPETFHPRKGRLRRLPCNKCPAAMPIWTFVGLKGGFRVFTGYWHRLGARAPCRG